MDASEMGIAQDGALWNKLKPYRDAAKAVLAHETSYGNIVIAERDPMRFLGALFASIEAGKAVFLANPEWKESTWEAFRQQIKGGYAFSEDKPGGFGEAEANNRFLKYIMIPTGGSTGGLKLAIHDWETLKHSAERTRAFIGAPVINSVCLLPLYHVSGLMQAVRAIVSGGDTLFLDTKAINSPERLPEVGSEYVISLVPTQLARLLQDKAGVNWLKRFGYIFIGGAKTDDALLERAREASLNISNCYGSTETAGMATACQPKDFLAGNNGVGKSLAGVRIHIFNTEARGKGLIKISGNLYKGYYPDLSPKNRVFATNDLGVISEEGDLTIHGRNDSIINTGGEKVDADEVNAAMRQLPGVEDVFTFGIQDAEWGEQAVALVVMDREKTNTDELKNALKRKLENYKIPKAFVAVAKLPMNAAGKVSKDEAIRLFQETNISRKGSLAKLEEEIETRQSRLKAEVGERLSGIETITLEIGCGHGDYLAAYGESFSAEYCVGIDILAKRLKKAENKRNKRGLKNVQFVKAEGNELLEALPEITRLGKIFILFPDPWPKRRHERNRLLQHEFLDLLARHSAADAYLFLRTDHEAYWKWAKEQIRTNAHWEEDTEYPWPFEQETFFQKLTGKHQSIIAKRSRGAF